MGRALQRYKKLFDEIKKDAPHRIYFLYGPEEFLKREFIAELIRKRLSEENRAFNLDILHGDDFDRNAFSDRTSSFPLFADRRMVVLRQFEALSSANQDFVLERLASLGESVIFVAEGSSTKLDTARLKRLQQIADERGLSFCFQTLSDEESIDRVKARIQREGFSITPDALELLVESVGTKLIDLANEVEKIVLSVDKGAVITRDAVTAVVGRYRTENLFGFLDQMGTRETGVLVSGMHRVLDGGEEPVFILAMMIRRTLQLLSVRLLMEEPRATPKSMTARMSGTLSPFQITILLEQAKRFQSDELKLLLNNLRWVDTKIKSSSTEPRHLLETALVATSERKPLAVYGG